MAVAAPFIPWIMAAGTAFSVVSGIQAANYQAKVAENNAKISEENAIRETAAANKDAQSRDINAMQTIAELQAEMDASGLNSSSGTMLLRRRSVEELATSDRENLAAKKEANLTNRKNEAASYRAEGKAAKKAGVVNAIGGVLSIPTSYLSGATMVNDFNKLQVRGRASTIGGL